MIVGAAAGRRRHRAVPSRRADRAAAADAGDSQRAAGMGLFGALDDIGLTVGPALAGVLLAVDRADDPDGRQRRHLRDLGAADRPLARPTRARGARRRAPRAIAVRGRPRGHPRGRPRGPRSARCSRPPPASCCASASRTSARSCSPARSWTSAAPASPLMVTAGGVGTVLGSLGARFTAAGAWHWRRAYLVGLGAMAVELLACARPALASGSSSRRSPSAASATASRSSTTACCSSDAPRSPCTAASSPCRRRCVSLAFAISFVGAGALIAAGGVQLRVPARRGRRPAGVIALALPRLRQAWPPPGPAATAAPATR